MDYGCVCVSVPGWLCGWVVCTAVTAGWRWLARLLCVYVTSLAHNTFFDLPRHRVRIICDGLSLIVEEQDFNKA